MSFCHLHVHNEYSLLDGVGKAKDYLRRVKELNQEALALTNHGNIDGLLDFQKEAQKAEILPILGCELYVVPDMSKKEKNEKRYHLTVLIKNQTGFENLCCMLTKANLRGFYHRPRVDFKLVLRHSSGLVFLTGCSSSPLLHEPQFIFDLQKIVKDDVYLEVMPHDLPEQRELNKICSQLHHENAWPMIATNDCHYIKKEDSVLQEVLLAVQTKATWKDKNRFRFGVDSLYLCSEQEMKESFRKQNVLLKSEYLMAMRQTQEVVDKCKNFKIEKKTVYLPSTNGLDLGDTELLESLCLKGYQTLFGKSIMDDEVYLRRFEEEFALIKKKNFVRYFLIVKDLVDWCHQQSIMIGPGRGSVGGSLIAYLLGITTVDPIKYRLLFSRFINEDRIDYPDIDLDFEDTKRSLIREHLEEKYGKNNIASVSTFLQMKSRMAVRDVARVFDVPYSEVDEFAKVVSDEDGSFDQVSSHWFAAKYPQVVDYASRLVDQIRGCGQHAAALIVSAEDLTQGTRGNLAMRSNQEVINWDKDDAEYMGLMKLDVLGLNTLSVLSETKKLVKQNHNQDLVFENISLDNKDVLGMLSRGETVGVFQFNTWATTKLCKQIGIDNFGIMSDAVALVRPGPMDSGMADDYVKRKHGGRWKKKHQLYESITKDTFGIIIYQEQIMEVIYKVAGLPYSVADKIRKIIAKKREADGFEKYRQLFMDGCKKQGTMTEEEANDFWLTLEKHANYSFNKSHSVEYAMIAYWCAFCKLFYPAEFICANLTYGSEGKKEELVNEAVRLGLKVIPPKIGLSDAFKWKVKDDEIYVPFIEIKGIGEKTAEECAQYKIIDQQRAKGFFGITPVRAIGKIGKILEEIGAYEGRSKGDLKDYFSFTIPESNSIGSLNQYIPGVFLQKKYRNDNTIHCRDCMLRGEAKRPVLSSYGIYNIPVIGEAPGRDEDEEGKGFIGKAGDLLWKEFWKYRLTRRQFHICNVCRCYPGSVRTPKPEHIIACAKWLDDEIKQLNAKICLALGNTPLKYFRGDDGGIMKLSGTTEWNEAKQIWICWSLHPSAVLRNPTNRPIFEEGIKNFADKLQLLGGLK
jgi:DNA polymerase-3 subunit alpha